MNTTAVFLLCFTLADTCYSAVIYVPQDYASIQNAIDSAASGDSVIISDGHYFERIAILGKPITVASNFILDSDTNHIAATILDGDSNILPATDSNSVILIADITAGETKVVGLTIQNGTGSLYRVFSILNSVGGGIFSARATSRISNCIIRNNVSNNFGGGVFSYVSPIFIDNCLIDSNETSNGGGICLVASTGSQVKNSLIKDNYGSEGGGAWISFAPALVENCRFTNNGSFYGGGLFIQDNLSNIKNCNFNNNRAFRGGGIYSYQGADGDIINCEFYNNTASLQLSQSSAGGAICCLASSPLIRNCTMHLNYADSGGGIYINNSASPDIENCIITSSRKGRAVSCSPSLAIDISCTNIFGNADLSGNPGGDWVGCLAFRYLVNGNMILDPLYCQSNPSDLTLKSTSPCLPQNNSCGILMGANGQGCIVTAIAVNVSELPEKFKLNQNYPNPFNPSTSIEYSLPQKSHVKIFVTNILGERVATLLNEIKAAGSHTLKWDGRNDNGTPVAGGVYIYSIETEEFIDSKKMILLK